MPVLHRYIDLSGYYIKTTHFGHAVTLQLTLEGEAYLVKKLGFRDESQFNDELLDTLREREWVFTHGGPPGEVLVGREPEALIQTDEFGSKSNLRSQPIQKPKLPDFPPFQPIKTSQQHRLRLRLESYDHFVLDTAVREIVEAIKKFDCSVFGPIPLPTRIERYLVVKRLSRSFEIRTHKRLIDIVGPTPETIATLNRLTLPAGVSITIRAGSTKS